MQSNFTNNPPCDRDNSPLVVSFGDDQSACSQAARRLATRCSKCCGETPVAGIRCACGRESFGARGEKLSRRNCSGGVVRPRRVGDQIELQIIKSSSTYLHVHHRRPPSCPPREAQPPPASPPDPASRTSNPAQEHQIQHQEDEIQHQERQIQSKNIKYITRTREQGEIDRNRAAREGLAYLSVRAEPKNRERTSVAARGRHSLAPLVAGLGEVSTAPPGGSEQHRWGGRAAWCVRGRAAWRTVACGIRPTGPSSGGPSTVWSTKIEQTWLCARELG
ncbi:unnamed protein product [Urochloa humidicola]